MEKSAARISAGESDSSGRSLAFRLRASDNQHSAQAGIFQGKNFSS